MHAEFHTKFLQNHAHSLKVRHPPEFQVRQNARLTEKFLLNG